KEQLATDDGRMRMVRSALPGAGEWRHQWADGGRTGIGDESRLTMPLELLWFGGPGPDRMMDRHLRTAAPLSVAGRVFVTGEHDLIAFDAYTGRELWTRPMRGLARRNVMWTASNIVAGDTELYVALGPACYCIDQATGRLLATFAMPEEVSNTPAPWGYVELADGMLLGSCLANSALFALDKYDAALRWTWMPEHKVSLPAIAHGGGRVFCLNTGPVDHEARRRGIVQKPVRTLVALDLATGAEAWRATDVPATPQDHVQYANGVVSVYANVAYDAATGAELWRRVVNPERPPLIHGDWIIAQPHAFHLRTGEQRMAADPVTGAEEPWEYIQSYGCGGVAGCETMLFFRSGVAGFYDFGSEGTTTFGGLRVGCAINMTPANGLVIMPESSSGCTCSYNFQTCAALAPANDRPAPWFVFAGRTSSAAPPEAYLNLGAPGDRLDADGRRWLSVPRPILGGAAPVALHCDGDYFRQPSESTLADMDKPWLYGSGVHNPGRITIDLVGLKPIEALPCGTPMVCDGKLDGMLLANGTPAPISLSFSSGLDREARAYLRYDDASLYVAIITQAEEPGWATANDGDTPGGGTSIPANGSSDARVWEDDSWELYLSDGARKACVHLGISASGARFDGLWDYTAFDALHGLDRSWTGVWESGVSAEGNRMVTEFAVPFTTLEAAGLDRDTLCMNLIGTGPGDLGSPDFLSVQPDGFSAHWQGAIEAPTAGAYTLTLRTDGDAVLRLDGESVIQHKGTGEPAESSVEAAFEAGVKRTLDVVYHEGDGPAIVQILWSGPGIEKSVVPAGALSTPNGAPGLAAAYRNRWYEDPVLERIDPALDFEWPAVDLKAPKAELRSHGRIRPQRCETFLPVSFGPATVDHAYTVRLHFAEIDPLSPASVCSTWPSRAKPSSTTSTSRKPRTAHASPSSESSPALPSTTTPKSPSNSPCKALQMACRLSSTPSNSKPGSSAPGYTQITPSDHGSSSRGAPRD
ncbi:MAG TPA: hypothetical protein ENN80_01250, partial [Candidatus Hydrogenedentes bacterium]|nr:hypothetical protein [Candidatus Hydrogenedentota bacterium]